MVKSNILLLVLGISTVAPQVVDAAIIYAVVDDFSTTTNSDTSTWSYRFSNDLARDGVYPLLTTFDDRANW